MYKNQLCFYTVTTNYLKKKFREQSHLQQCQKEENIQELYIYIHSSKAFWCSAFFIVQLSHPYMTTGKTIALTRRTFVDKVMSLLFNMLSRLVITFLPRSKRFLISWLQSPSAVILEPRNIKSVTVSTVFIPIPKKGNAKECSNYRTRAVISHGSKVMLEILQARLQLFWVNIKEWHCWVLW